MSFFGVVFEACQLGNKEPLINFLKNNPNFINTQNENGDTAAHIAARAGDHAVIEILQRYNPNMHISNHANETPRGLMIGYANDLYDPELLSAFDNEQDENVLKFCRDRNESEIKLILKDYPDQINNILVAAAANGWQEMVVYALENGADLGYAPNGERNAFYQAIYGGHVNIARLLINQNLDILYTFDDRGDNILVNAVSNGETEMVDFLIELGINVNIIDRHGNTALHHAINNYANLRDISIVERLLGYGANIYAENNYGMSPFSLAAEMGGEVAERIAMARMVDINIGHVPNMYEFLGQNTGLENTEPVHAGDIMRVSQEINKESNIAMPGIIAFLLCELFIWPAS